MKFKDMAKDSKLQNNPSVLAIVKKFPEKSTLIGIKKNDNIILIDGMHRCSVIAVAHEIGAAIHTNLSIILAEFPGDVPILGQANSPT